MEMSLDKLKLEDMPDDEKEFIAAVQALPVPEYAAGYASEQNLHHFLLRYFSYLNQYSDLALLRIGSAGRYEGFAIGEAEFVLLTSPGIGDSPLHLPVQDLHVLLSRPLPIPGQAWETKSRVELKNLTNGEPLAYYEGKVTNRPFPGRVLEAVFVAGNPSLYWEARRRTLEEAVGTKDILRDMRRMRKEHRDICEKGVQRFKQETIQHLDVDRGIVYHDPKCHVDGLKYSFLRYVQTALSVELFALVARNGIPAADVIDLNQSVEERIRYCFRKEWVKNKEPLIDAGCAYIELAAAQGKVKWEYLANGRKEFQLEDADGLKTAYAQIVPAFEAGVLIE